MNTIELLIQQTKDSYNWTNRLIDSIPQEHWETIPEGVKSNINWQVGHLIMAHYFNGVMLVRGHQKEVFEHIPLKEYSDFFTMNAADASLGKVDSKNLRNQLEYMQELSLKIIGSITVDELENEVEPTKVRHPFAKTKFQTIDWNMKHTMWHCGQIAILKRELVGRQDFGLKV